MQWQEAQLSRFGRQADGFLDRNGCRLHYLDSGGEGRPVILVHGINQNVRTWELVLPELEGPWRLIALDQRGHGLSEAPGVTYKRGDLVADARALIEHLGLRQPILVGHSLGGWLGMSVEGRFPGTLGGIVVGDMTANVGVEQPASAQAVMTAALAPGAGDASWADADEAYAVLRAANPREGDAEVKARMRQQLRRRADGRLERARSAEVARAILEEVRTTDLWPLLPNIACPVLLIHAGDSDVLLPEYAERMVRILPNARLATVPGCPHNLQIFQPAIFGQLIAGFLREMAGY